MGLLCHGCGSTISKTSLSPQFCYRKLLFGNRSIKDQELDFLKGVLMGCWKLGVPQMNEIAYACRAAIPEHTVDQLRHELEVLAITSKSISNDSQSSGFMVPEYALYGFSVKWTGMAFGFSVKWTVSSFDWKQELVKIEEKKTMIFGVKKLPGSRCCIANGDGREQEKHFCNEHNIEAQKWKILYQARPGSNSSLFPSISAWSMKIRL
ncbi:hypothetical protein Dimus_032880 [Dionaea muscipula]